MKHTILVASTNPGKMKELSEMLAELGEQIEWVSLRDYPEVPEVIEDGDTFAANARKKAIGYARATGLWTLADDSGLLIDALNGQPGVHSARFAAADAPSGDRKAIDKANYQKVLSLMENVPQDRRTARFQCHLCLAGPNKVLLEAVGYVEGSIGYAPAGQNGFGYDPIFYVCSLGKTAAQLDAEQKNRISHRGRAIAALLPQLKTLLSDTPGR